MRLFVFVAYLCGAVIATGAFVFQEGDRVGAFRNTEFQPVTVSKVEDRVRYKPFHPIFFAIDAFVPGLDLGYESSFEIDQPRYWRPRRSGSPLFDDAHRFFFVNGFFPTFYTVYVITGWMLSALATLALGAALARLGEEPKTSDRPLADQSEPPP